MTQRERERAWTEAPIGAGTRLIGEALGRRKWPLLLSCTTVVAGMLYLFFWGRVVHRGDAWTSAGDLWGIFRAAHYVGWGYLGGVYDPSTGFISLPGMPTLLAPVAVLSGSLHLTESAMPNFLQRPRAILILEPAELVLASTVLFAADALAERLAVTSRNRLVLSILVAMVAWPVVAIWGHGEDVLALTLAGYALLAVLNGRWARGGWLLGLGIAVQPLVALLVPLVVGVTPAGQRLRTLVRSAAISVVLVGVAAAGDLHDTLRAVVEQPTPPSINHATPWVFLAPRVGSSLPRATHASSLVLGIGHPVSSTIYVPPAPILVSGGAGRLIDALLAVLVGFYVWRRPQPAERLIWLVAAILASRCFFEAVMTPYYLAPPLIVALVLAARREGRRFVAAAIVTLEVTVFAYHHLNPWLWWVTVVVGLGAVLGLGAPAGFDRRLSLNDLSDDEELATTSGSHGVRKTYQGKLPETEWSGAEPAHV